MILFAESKKQEYVEFIKFKERSFEQDKDTIRTLFTSQIARLGISFYFFLLIQFYVIK